MRIAIVSPICWRTPPRHYGPWEMVASLVAEGLGETGEEVTLFATGDSITRGRLLWTCPRPLYEDPNLDSKVEEYLHVSSVFEEAKKGSFDLVHNHYDFMPLAFSRMVDTPVVTTIHGFSGPSILPVYRKYSGRVKYVSISNASRHSELEYIDTVYHGIPVEEYRFGEGRRDGLAYLGRIAPDKGTHLAIETSLAAGERLTIAGIVQDRDYFREMVEPHLDGDRVRYIGPIGIEGKNALLPSCVALLHMAPRPEAFGLSLVESMACGTPVVAYPYGSIPEVVEDGVTGRIVQDVREGVRAIAGVSSLDPRPIREWVKERFSRERMVQGYLGVYRRVLEEHTS
jgi:glycosyltransferase involved in cell wall biosynthesis